MNAPVDSINLQFSPVAALGLQFILALIIFGVALELRLADFVRLLREPRVVLIGLFSQLIVLPLLTLALVFVANPAPSIALGLMLTAACPGGNMSNVLTHWSGGRTSLAMTMTSISSLISPLTTPLIFGVLGGLHPATRSAMHAVSVPYNELIGTILIALVAPLMLGMVLVERWPQLAEKLRKPFKRLGLAVFAMFVVLAAAANHKIFWQLLTTIFVLVAVHNAIALASGYGIARLFRTGAAETRAITFETGVHNTALGLTLVFTYYQGLGGMALVLAWWGVWDLITGGVLARYWSRRLVVSDTR